MTGALAAADLVVVRAQDAVVAWGADRDDPDIDVPSLDWAMSRLADALHTLARAEGRV